ncbi:exonuclease V [Aspergillus ambiguus]|uniref:exonuclease V n=1 Tax=Aspergillus ambiguus TaxID=176160 RepID=UPI003CCDFF49
MSCSPSPQNLMSDNNSDYGSDFTPDEEELINELLAKAVAEHATTAARTTTPTPTTPEPLSQGAAAAPVGDIEDYGAFSPSPRTPKVRGRQMPPWQLSTPHLDGATRRADQTLGVEGTTPVEHPASTEGRERERERDIARERGWTTDGTASADMRSPIERFRKPPNKAFSVTDLVSPAWCELQYWYTLTKHGRKRRTPAMKAGSTIHKTLEDEVHTTVPIEITTKEDALALRLWNVIQGLRTLREFGITRELEVWGLVDGELVNGVIDQLSYECPDAELEASAASFYADVEASRAVMPEYQMSLTDYLLSPSQGGKRLSDLSWKDENHDRLDDSGRESHSSQSLSEAFDVQRVYLTDVKTRASNSAPTVKSTSFRPTLLQLQMYYHMLNRMVTSDDVSVAMLAARYGLDPDRAFTDAFIAEVGGLNDQFVDALSNTDFDSDFIPGPEDAIARQPSHTPPRSVDDGPSSSQDSTSVLLSHNNLSSLWKLMKYQLRLTFSPPMSSEVSVAPSIPSEFQPHVLEPYQTVISPLLTARYLSSEPTADLRPRVLGSRSFLFDPTAMTSYLSDQMEWWRGQRDPRGVEVMEAWKCRICEFREECSWRQEKEWIYARRKRSRRSPSLVDV